MFVNVNTQPVDVWFDLVCYCNYEPVQHVFEADTKKGYALSYKTDPNGIVMFIENDPKKGPEIIRHKGIVQLFRLEDLHKNDLIHYRWMPEMTRAPLHAKVSKPKP
jgi:hypothetical protein